jgi:hypothetical protein
MRRGPPHLRSSGPIEASISVFLFRGRVARCPPLLRRFRAGGASAGRSFTAVAAASGAPALSRRQDGSSPRVCGLNKEENMKVLSLVELLQLSRVELCDMLAQLTNVYPCIPEGSDESFAARYNLRLIRRALALRAAAPP